MAGHLASLMVRKIFVFWEIARQGFSCTVNFLCHDIIKKVIHLKNNDEIFTAYNNLWSHDQPPFDLSDF